MTISDFITEAFNLLNTFGVMPIVLAGAVAGLGAFLLRRIRSAVK